MRRFIILPFTNCHLGDEIKKNEKGGAHSSYGRHKKCKRFLAGKPGGKTPLVKARSVWEDTINMDLQAHTDNSRDARTTKWKKLTTVELNVL